MSISLRSRHATHHALAAGYKIDVGRCPDAGIGQGSVLSEEAPFRVSRHDDKRNVSHSSGPVHPAILSHPFLTVMNPTHEVRHPFTVGMAPLAAVPHHHVEGMRHLAVVTAPIAEGMHLFVDGIHHRGVVIHPIVVVMHPFVKGMDPFSRRNLRSTRGYRVFDPKTAHPRREGHSFQRRVA